MNITQHFRVTQHLDAIKYLKLTQKLKVTVCAVILITLVIFEWNTKYHDVIGKSEIPVTYEALSVPN